MIALTKRSETATTLTLGWTPVPGCIGYRFSSEKQAKPSFTWNPATSSVKFAKGSAWYKVEAFGVSEAGDYSPSAPPPPPPPPPTGWTQVAVEHGNFTLTASSEVRYGAGTAWSTKVLGPGTYACDNPTFGDPAPGADKVCEARTTVAPPPMQVRYPSSTLYPSEVLP